MAKDEFINIPYNSPIKITRQLRLGCIKKYAAQYSRGNLIDLGCGIKPYEQFFTPYVDNYFGVDYEPAAETNYQDLTRADLFADCTDTGLESDSYDTLLSTQVIEHVLDTKKFISECYRLLKKDGIGIFTIPFVWQLHAEPYDYYRFTRFLIESQFQDAGFEILELKPIEGPLATINQTKIISLFYHGKIKNRYLAKFYNIYNKIRIPIINYFTLKFDHMIENKKTCLNYILIVKK